MSGASVRTLIYAKLAEAATGTGLEVHTHADLDGASVVGPVVEAYVIAVGRGGFQVDMWTAVGRDPFKIECFSELDAAVVTAVNAARGRRRITKQAKGS